MIYTIYLERWHRRHFHSRESHFSQGKFHRRRRQFVGAMRRTIFFVIPRNTLEIPFTGMKMAFGGQRFEVDGVDHSGLGDLDF